MRNPFSIQEDPLYPVPKEAYGWRIYFLAVSAAWASAIFGYDQAFIGSTQSLPSYQHDFGIVADTPRYTAVTANVTSLFQAGCFFGSILGYFVAERFGRRPQLIGSGLLGVVGAALQVASAGRLGFMYAGRVLLGLCIGASSMCVPIYISESAPAPIRGRLVGIFEVSLQLAGIIGFWISYGVQRHLDSSPTQWKIPFALQLVFLGLLIISMFLQEESPRWLVKQGRCEEAAKVLSGLRSLNPSHPYIVKEMAEMRIATENSPLGAGIKFWQKQVQTLLKPGVRNRVLLAVSLKVFQNLTGLQAINYYSPVIFKSIGLTGTATTLLATGIFGIVKAVFTIITMFIAVDSIGRRPLLLWGSAGSLVCMYYLGAYCKLSGSFTRELASVDAGGYVAIVMTYLFVVCFAFSWNGVPWIFASEVFPNSVRALGMMISMCSTWLVQFAIVYSTPYMIQNIQYGMFFFFGACITVALVHTWLFIPETKGIQLEHMDYLFNGPILAPAARREAENQITQHSEVMDVEDLKAGPQGIEHVAA